MTGVASVLPAFLTDYTTRVVLGGVALLGASSGITGAWLLLRRRSLSSDVASHAALPGAAAAFLVVETAFPGWGRSPWVLLAGAAMSGVLALAMLQVISQSRKRRDDSALAIVLGLFFGAGVVLLSIVQSLPLGSAAGLSDLIFGKAAALTMDDVIATAVCGSATIIGCSLLSREWTLLCFDPEFAAASGSPVKFSDAALLTLALATTLVGLPSVGLLLSVSLLIIPPAAARFWTDRLNRLPWYAAAIGATGGAIGVLISAAVPKVAAGAVIVLVEAALFAVSFAAGWEHGVVWYWLRDREHRRRAGELDLLRACYEQRELQTPPPTAGASAETSESATDQLAGSAIDENRLLPARGWSPDRLASLIRGAIHHELLRRDSQGVLRLTAAGARSAALATRQHRLWELYLANVAQLDPRLIDSAADMMEHAASPELIATLERMLEPMGGAVPASPHAISAPLPLAETRP